MSSKVKTLAGILARIRARSESEWVACAGKPLACASGLYCQTSDNGSRSRSNSRQTYVFAAIVFLVTITFGSASLAQTSDSAKTATLNLKNKTTTSGTIVNIADNKIVVETVDEKLNYDFDEIKSFEFGGSAASPDSLTAIAELLDGSVVRCEQIGLTKRLLKFKTGCGTELELNSREVRSIRFATQATDADLKFWQQMNAQANQQDAVPSDLLVVKREDRLSEVEGRIQAISDKEVSFTIGDRTADVKRSKIFGLIFYRTGNRASRSIATVNLVDGSKFFAKKLLGVQNDELEILAASDATLNFKLADLAKVDFGGMTESFLSDIEPTTIDWQPLFKSTAATQMRSMKLPLFNTGFLKRPLSLKVFDIGRGAIERREFAKGIAMPGGSKVAFDLGKRFKTLTGVVGFDSDASSAGKVTLIVSGDGKTILREDLVNERKQQPLELDVQIDNVSRLVIEVGYCDGRPIGDLLNLCDLKLAK